MKTHIRIIIIIIIIEMRKTQINKRRRKTKSKHNKTETKRKKKNPHIEINNNYLHIALCPRNVEICKLSSVVQLNQLSFISVFCLKNVSYISVLIKKYTELFRRDKKTHKDWRRETIKF